MKYWLMKTEPDVFGWEDLLKKGETSWEGVRNYQARNFMRDDMKTGDLVLFYHSSCEVPGIMGVAKVSREAHPDLTALDKKSPYYDEKSHKFGESRWCMVSVIPVRSLSRPVTLAEIRTEPKLKEMLLIRPGQRLSIQPVAESDFKFICEL